MSRLSNIIDRHEMRPPSGLLGFADVAISDGLSIDVPARSPSLTQLVAGIYENDVTDLIRRLIEPNMRVLDIGANIGYYTVIASTLVGPRGHVYSFEPDPDVYQFLQRNIEKNSCENVTAVPKAVLNYSGSGDFVQHELERGFVQAPGATTPSVAVESVTLDEFFADIGWPRVDLIKMDIEGLENSALKGMQQLSHRNPHLRLIMEFNLTAMRRAGVTRGGLTDSLKEVGFTRCQSVERGLKRLSLAKALPRSDLVSNLLLSKQ